ncbi:MAG: hypothetical protein GEV11_11790 [Streptosporangiales bacterium]|nr:hypothetical protein [Streptosporangiales bacterium]
MAEWISVFCRTPVEPDPAALHRVLDDLDLAAAAGVRHGLPDLRVETARDAGASIDVHYRADGRPIQLSTLVGREAAGQVTETLAELPLESKEAGVLLVREHLNMCVQVINIELDAAAEGDLGTVLGTVLGAELAYAIAEDGDGLVWLFDREWISPADRTTPVWTHPD